MPEMLTPTSALVGAGMSTDVALVTDGRFSGGSHGFIVGHVTPEAQEGGAIALIQNGDLITIDAEAGRIEVDVSENEMHARAELWRQPPIAASFGVLRRYVRQVAPASQGCVTDE